VVPQEVADTVARLEKEITAGTLQPFTGPVVGNARKERLPAGKVMDGDTLSKMDYYVQGVQGKLPSK